jgi:hypothetical protein
VARVVGILHIAIHIGQTLHLLEQRREIGGHLTAGAGVRSVYLGDEGLDDRRSGGISATVIRAPTALARGSIFTATALTVNMPTACGSTISWASPMRTK